MKEALISIPEKLTLVKEQPKLKVGETKMEPNSEVQIIRPERGPKPLPADSPFTQSAIDQVTNPVMKAEVAKLVADAQAEPFNKWKTEDLITRWKDLSMKAAQYEDSGVSSFTSAMIKELAKRGPELQSRGRSIPNIFTDLANSIQEVEEGRDPIAAQGPDEGDELTVEQRVFQNLREEVNNYAARSAREGRDLAQEARIVDKIEALMSHYPVVEASTVPAQLLEIASFFPELREKLINRIIFKAYEDITETNPYLASMNLYASSNLDTLLGYLSQHDPRGHEHYVSLKTGAQYFHEMNAKLNEGNLEEFIVIAQKINYQHFELMQSITGTGEVMRLYEQKYDEFLARDGRITTEGYKELKEEVRTAFNRMNNFGLVRSEFSGSRVGPDARRLADWEVERALNAGRVFFSITFRAAEKIASGRVPRAGDQNEKRYASFPQEQAAKLMNWIQWGGWRFEVGKERGGLKFLTGVKNKNQEYWRLWNKKKGINRFTRIGGMNVNELEDGGMFAVSGIYSSWRIETLAYNRIMVGDVTLRQWLDKVVEYEGKLKSRAQVIDQIKKDAKDKSKTSAGKKGKPANIETIEKELHDFIKPLIDNLDLGQGAVLKQILEGAGGYQARVAMWNRVAEVNLPTIINLLSSVRRVDDDPIKEDMDGTIGGNNLDANQEPQDVNLIDQLRQGDITDWNHLMRWNNSTRSYEEISENQLVNGELRKTRWDILMEKVLFNHEVRIKAAALGERIDVPEEMRLDFNERRILSQITSKGKEYSKDLADIVFPYVPFVNDLPFEVLSYSGPGEEFYRRRTGGDIGSYYQAEQAFNELLGNPGGLGVEKTLDAIGKVLKGIEGPQGTPDSHERAYPLFHEYFQLIMAKPWQRHSIIKGFREFIRKPTSEAQKDPTKEGFAGIKAPSLDPLQAKEIIDQAIMMGLLNADLAKTLKKEDKLTIAWLIWHLFKEVFYIPEVILAKEILDASLKPAA